MEKVEMTAEERREFEAFRAEKKKKEAAELRKQQRATYQQMVDDELAQAVPELRRLSQDIRTVKDAVFGNFQTVLQMKEEVVGFKEDGQFSHTFTNSESTLRLTLGVNTVDGWSEWYASTLKALRQMKRPKPL